MSLSIYIYLFIFSGWGWWYQLFDAAADVLRRIGEDARIIQEFVELGKRAKIAALEAMDAEAALGDIPDEFLDPIQVNHEFLTFLFWIHLYQTISYSALFSIVFCYYSFFWSICKRTIVSWVSVHFDEGSCHFAFIKGHCGQAGYPEASFK